MHIFYENHGCLTIFQNQTCINVYDIKGFNEFDN